MLAWDVRPLNWPLRGDARGFGDADGLRMPLTGLEEADEGADSGDDLKYVAKSR